MSFDFGSAVLAGLAGTAVMTGLMMMGGRMMGVRMDMPMTLGTMFLPKGNGAWAVGLMAHVMMGVIFFIAYALLFDALGISSHIGRWGALFGVIHAIGAGAVFGMMPAIHPRMSGAGVGSGADSVPAPGVMGMGLGSMAPMAIVLVHASFGLAGGWTYSTLN